jgi:hypothetical protein
VSELRTAGFTSDAISVLLPDTGTARTSRTRNRPRRLKGATAGGAAGLGVGAALGWLAGVGALAIPGPRSVHRGRPDHGGAQRRRDRRHRGRPDRRAHGHGHPEFEAKRYKDKIGAGNILISVHTEDGKQKDLAKEIFKRNGAEDISTGGEDKAKAA